MLANYRKFGTNISIKLHFLHIHLNRFPENSDDRSDEQAEHFHRNIKVMEDRNQERWDKKTNGRLLLAPEKKKKLDNS